MSPKTSSSLRAQSKSQVSQQIFNLTNFLLCSYSYEIRYKFTDGVTVDPDSVRAKFSKKNHTLTLTLEKKRCNFQ